MTEATGFLFNVALSAPTPVFFDFAERKSDDGPSKAQAKTQTTPDSVFFCKGKEILRPWSEFGVFFGVWGRQGVLISVLCPEKLSLTRFFSTFYLARQK